MYIRITTQSKVRPLGVSLYVSRLDKARLDKVEACIACTHCRDAFAISQASTELDQAHYYSLSAPANHTQILKRDASRRLQAGRQRLEVDPDPSPRAASDLTVCKQT